MKTTQEFHHPPVRTDTVKTSAGEDMGKIRTYSLAGGNGNWEVTMKVSV